MALEGLALRYRWVAERLETLLGRRYETLYIVGGGARNALLCQFAADALNRPVSAGPAEGTALGNIALQAVATGAAPNLQYMRNLVRNASSVKTYLPLSPSKWNEPYQRFSALVA